MLTNSFEYLCTCNMCSSVYIDMNPGAESKEYEIPYDWNIRKLEWIKLDDGDTGWGCPNCKTDGFLVDNINEKAGGQAEALFTELQKL